jgi:hypothetical protein
MAEFGCEDHGEEKEMPIAQIRAVNIHPEDRTDPDVALEDWPAKEGLLAAIFIDFLRRHEGRRIR